LHSSELNITDTTRHVVSLRITLDKPRFYGPSKARFVYCAPSGHSISGMIETLGRKAAAVISPFSKLEHDRPEQPSDDTSSRFPTPLPSAPSRENSCGLSVDTSVLPAGEIRPISKTMCIARLDTGRVVVFERYCPHEGSDLAGAFLKNGSVVCQWHNLPI